MSTDGRQEALEILGKAIDTLLPDFRASGDVVEHATKVAAELVARYGPNEDDRTMEARENDPAFVRMCEETVRLKKEALAPRGRMITVEVDRNAVIVDVLRIAAPASRLVGSAAALEVARNVAQVMISDPSMDIAEVSHEAVLQRILHPDTYGESWAGASVLDVATALVKGWRDR